MLSTRFVVGISFIALALSAVRANSLELLPQLAEKPLVFASKPNEFAGKPDFRTITRPMDSSGAAKFITRPDYAAVRLTIRATEPDTKSVEMALHQKNGQVWGMTALPLSTEWREMTLKASQLSYFSHWGLPPVDSTALPDLTQLKQIHFGFGKCLCKGALDKPHGFEVKSVKVVMLKPHVVSELGRASGWDVSLDEFPRLDGELDDTRRICRALDAVPSRGVLFFPRGVYTVSSMLHVDNGCSVQMHKGAIIKATREMPFVIDFKATQPTGDYNGFFTGGTIDGMGLASCMRMSDFKHFTMRDVTFLNGREAGLKVLPPGYELIAHNLYFKTLIPGLAGNVALDIHAGDSHFVDCVSVDYTVGFAVRRGPGANRLTRCHAWGGPLPPVRPGEEREMLKDSINFLIEGSGTILRDCYADTGKTGFYISGWENRLFGCSYFNNRGFGLDDITIVRHEKGSLRISGGCFYKTASRIKIYDGCGDVEWRDMIFARFSKDELPGMKSAKETKDQATP